MRLVSLYGDIYTIYGDTHSMEILLYLVERTKVTCVRSLNINMMLPLGTALEFSVIDNLLVYHSLECATIVVTHFGTVANLSNKAAKSSSQQGAYPVQPPVVMSEATAAAVLKAIHDKNDVSV
ncbi:hypothetical protein PsorP6_003590 [Peronosclerospora sorghi]|uniref:Uncharacterized protein n=1 Tax=Peronosclerospora sorghi TaxID=230839 RepID=A0ACC0VQH2_9STRA|nr:hypothetical protein PsorP6_003590 [Peronosclerospora sorghi]